ncbi:MAG: penicillin acylase family protein [bacterium]
MVKGWRRFFSVAGFVAVVAVTILVLCYRLLTKSLPENSGRLSLTMLSDSVEVYRDAFGVPHIFAANEQDLFRAQGYITAQDRLWQMDFNRRIACGRLAEIFGEKAVANDRHLRTWGFARMAKEILPILSPESRQALEAYAEGVNAFIDSHQDQLPIEFALLNYKPDKWRVEDSLAFTRFMAWKLSFSWYIEPVLGQLVEKLGTRKVREIIPGFPKSGPFIIPQEAKPFWSTVQPFLDSGFALRDLLGMQSAQLGSNSWVVSGTKSVSGKPLLANDPHLELTTPSVWYEVHLSGGEIDVAGVSLPGVPGVVIGHNENIAWGLTNGMVDDVDFYVEKINPRDSLQYRSENGWRQLKIVEEKIAVKDRGAVPLQIVFTQHGPIISQHHPLLKEARTAVAMRWTGQQPSDEMAAILKIMKAGNWHEFTGALREYKVPAQNFVFASASGDIGYYLGGAIPVRKNATGMFPHNGWLGRGEWLGEVPFEKLPHVLNPPEGFIVTANNKIVDDRYPYYITYLWEPPSRATRIRQRLAEKEKFSLDDFKVIQSDLFSTHAQRIMPLLLQAVRQQLESHPDEKLELIYNLIRDWDYVESAESIPTSIFHAFFLKLTENTLKDEMGETLFHNYIRLGNVPFRVVTALLERGRSDWFDNVNTREVETKPVKGPAPDGREILVKSLVDAYQWLRTLAGENISNWRWGEIHTLTMRHPLGVRRPLDALFNLGPFSRGGSTMTINNSEYRFGAPFDALLGASTRQLVDLANPEATWSVITTGESGQRMSRHYKDQTHLWLQGEYHAMDMNEERIARSAEEHLLLIPE